MPNPATIQATITSPSHESGRKAATASNATPAVMPETPMMIIWSRRQDSQLCDCSSAPAIQPTEPMVRVTPVITAASSRDSVSISGRNDWAPKKAPALNNRAPTTPEMPRPVQSMVLGSSGGSHV